MAQKVQTRSLVCIADQPLPLQSPAQLHTQAATHPEGFRPPSLAEVGQLVGIAKDAAVLVALIADFQAPVSHPRMLAREFKQTLDALTPQLAAGGYLEPYTRADGSFGIYGG